MKKRLRFKRSMRRISPCLILILSLWLNAIDGIGSDEIAVIAEFITQA